MRLIQLLRLGLLASVIYSSTSVAAVLDVQGGILFGASDVDVNGTLYDVQFLDGTCIDLYDGCDANTDFPFTNLLDLNDGALLGAAMTALEEQVFLDSSSGAFDTSPELTNGCAAPGGCSVFTPLWVNTVAGSAGVFSLFNRDSTSNDVIGAGGGSRTHDTTGTDLQVYAVWSQTTAVPIPAAVWLFGSGLVGIVGVARRKAA
jgi:hypothetical protein